MKERTNKKKWMHDNYITQADVARELKISRQCVNQYLNHRKGNIKLDIYFEQKMKEGSNK